jgi:hypothetical protein
MGCEALGFPAGGFGFAFVSVLGKDSDVGSLFAPGFSILPNLSSGFVNFVDIVGPSVAIEVKVFASGHDIALLAVFQPFQPCHDLISHS